MKDYSKIISGKLNISHASIFNTLKLLEEGCTIPFISRYRKEVTGSLSETQIKDIQKKEQKLKELDRRKETILKEIHKQGKLNAELEETIKNSGSLLELEDLYIPYKPKKSTRADKAREMGLEMLAKKIMGQGNFNLEEEAKKYIKGKVKTAGDALKGAGDIIAEWVSEDKEAREAIRAIFSRESMVRCKAKNNLPQEASKFKDYFNYSEPLASITSHRFLAMKRGEREGYLKLSVSPDEKKAIEILEKMFLKNRSRVWGQVRLSIEDSYKRLIAPSIEKEFINKVKEAADSEAIKVFSGNLKQLLLSPVLGNSRVMALDPGYRTGCKTVCLDQQGDLVYSDIIYPNPPVERKKESAKKVKEMVERFSIEAIAIGNGSGGRETRRFIKSLKLNEKIKIFTVSENGASIYSASDIAREEFPEQDVTVRGAVSIGRRLIDPLSELVKIDPKSIGVGQYQHDVDQQKLKESLQEVVESCVNLVGANLNTSSRHLLMHISGLGKKTAQGIVDFRSSNGPFKDRKELKKVPGIGEKVFEQCAGFLRIPDGKNPLDRSGVHPESYYIAERMAMDLGMQVEDLIGGSKITDRIDIKRYMDNKAGLPTLKYLVEELSKPGRDPRENIDSFEFKDDVADIKDLKEGMILKGIITNITHFGAFVDLGIKNDGLVHISQISDTYIKNPQDVLSIHQNVEVKVIAVDIERGRVSLSMKGLN